MQIILKKNTKIWKKRKKKAEQLSIQTYPIIWSLHTQQIMHPGTKNLAIIKVYTWGHTLKWTKIPLQQSRGPASTHKIFGIETGNSNEYLQVPASLKWSCMTRCFTFLVRDQMLDNDIGHVVSVGVPVLVQTVDSTEYQLIVRDRPVLAPHCLYN